jgi:hypothetical protein
MLWVIGFAELVNHFVVSSVAFGSPDYSLICPKICAIKFNPTYQNFGTVTTPATVTKSIGLPADERACPELAKGHGFCIATLTISS